jgi:ubiquinone/menaquinone biosynthesis C-methylase UbiE
MPDWIREYFEHGYARRWGLRPPSEQVRLEADALYKLLGLSPQSLVVDVGCGHGRHAIALAESGVGVIGIDFTASLLTRAQELAAGRHLRTLWLRGDMRRLPLQSGCADAAMMLDAFGFFDSEEEHEAVLREAARILRTRGRLALKVVNGGLVLDAFREQDREERDGTVVEISRTLTLDPPRMTERLRLSGSSAGAYERRQRLYRIDELRTALEHAGFAIAGVFARADGTPFEATQSFSIWIVGQRRADQGRAPLQI